MWGAAVAAPGLPSGWGFPVFPEGMAGLGRPGRLSAIIYKKMYIMAVTDNDRNLPGPAFVPREPFPG